MFKAIFRDMDLYKGIILASLVLLPAAGGWAWWVVGRIEAGEQARMSAERRDGLLHQIGSLQREVEEVQESKIQTGGGPGGGHRRVFQGQIFDSSPTPMRTSDFTIGTEQDRRVSQLRAIDSEVTIEFKRDGKEPYALPRDYITALLHNFENFSQVWKLRNLRIRNEEAQRLVGQKKAPPPELVDRWLVERLVMARRRPDR